jgi:Domain of unknown function (DUF5664)
MNPQLGRKFDAGKPEFALLPPWALEAVSKVLTIGAQKYERDNWKYVPNGRFRYINAALRHLNAYSKGETTDPETGENHLAHAICCLMFILDSDESNVPLADAQGNIQKKFNVPAVNSVFAIADTLHTDSNTVNLSGVARPVNFPMTNFN